MRTFFACLRFCKICRRVADDALGTPSAYCENVIARSQLCLHPDLSAIAVRC